ncbi:MAG: hypothetical protein ACLQT7_04595 [Candidatus Dormibacteria bacterium]
MGAFADAASPPDLLDWADAECRAIATTTADALATRMWRVRISLETRLRREPDPATAQLLTERITALHVAEADLASVAAILRTMGAPITWREAADHIGRSTF